MGDFNIDLLECQSSKISQEFFNLSSKLLLLLFQQDKPKRVHRTSATLIDNIFVNDPRRLLASGDIIFDISDHFSQFYITTSAKDRLQQVKNIKICD